MTNTTRRPCKERDCELDEYKSREYCVVHYQELRKHLATGGTKQTFVTKPIKNKKKRREYADCKTDECDRKRRARGYCNAHYRRLLKHLNAGGSEETFVTKPIIGKVKKREHVDCKADECDKNHDSRGYCSTHSNQFRSHLAAGGAERTFVAKPIRNMVKRGRYVGCKTDDCDEKHLARGYCVVHYSQLYRHLATGGAEETFVAKLIRKYRKRRKL